MMIHATSTVPNAGLEKKAEQLPNAVNLSNQIYAREPCPSLGMYVLE
jgi:hypothetical protein